MANQNSRIAIVQLHGPILGIVVMYGRNTQMPEPIMIDAFILMWYSSNPEVA